MKKKLIFWAIVIAVVILILVIIKFTPFWSTILELIAFIVGGILGWFTKYLYDKYIKVVE